MFVAIKCQKQKGFLNLKDKKPNLCFNGDGKKLPRVKQPLSAMTDRH